MDVHKSWRHVKVWDAQTVVTPSANLDVVASVALRHYVFRGDGTGPAGPAAAGPM